MKKSNKAKFIKTALLPKDYPPSRNSVGRVIPEIAVAGRSNVGKSSLLNHLFHEKSLVKTSSTPGKTQALNFFILQDQISFADLPGYGYASVPEKVKKQWGPMIQTYLEKRETLKLILFLLDIRRVPNDQDKQFLEWVVYQNKAVILVLTKVDKVNQSEKISFTKRILEEFNVANLHYVHYSVTQNKGERELRCMIEDALQDEDVEEEMMEEEETTL